MGTKFEGYTHDALEKVFGEQLGKYVGEVSTLNDDVTYEIIFLKTCEEKKKIFLLWMLQKTGLAIYLLVGVLN